MTFQSHAGPLAWLRNVAIVCFDVIFNTFLMEFPGVLGNIFLALRHSSPQPVDGQHLFPLQPFQGRCALGMLLGLWVLAEPFGTYTQAWGSHTCAEREQVRKSQTLSCLCIRRNYHTCLYMIRRTLPGRSI